MYMKMIVKTRRIETKILEINNFSHYLGNCKNVEGFINISTYGQNQRDRYGRKYQFFVKSF